MQQYHKYHKYGIVKAIERGYLCVLKLVMRNVLNKNLRSLFGERELRKLREFFYFFHYYH